MSPFNTPTCYVQVESLQPAGPGRSLAAKKNAHPSNSAPKRQGQFAWFADPEGNTIGLIQK